MFKEMSDRGWLPTETSRLTWPQVRIVLGNGKGEKGRRLSATEARAMGLVR